MIHFIRHWGSFGMLLVMPSVTVASLWGQGRVDTVRISGVATCSDCRSTLEFVGALGGKEALEISLLQLSVVQLRDGRYLASGIGSGRSVLSFRADGSVEREVGRAGSGPGEFLAPVRVVAGSGDTAYVLDRQLRRISVMSPAGRFVRVIPTPQLDPVDLVDLGTGPLVLAGAGFSKAGAGYFLHRLGRDGDQVAPFGDELKSYNPRTNDSDLRRVIAPSGPSAFWVSRINRYALERRSATGELLRVIERAVDWFQPWQVNVAPIEERPNPVVTRIAADLEGRLWVFLTVASQEFKPLRRGPSVPGSRSTERGVPSLSEMFGNLDTIIEVLDPVRGALISSSRVRGYLFPATPFPLVARVEVRADGYEVVTLYRVNLVPAPVRRAPPDLGGLPNPPL